MRLSRRLLPSIPAICFIIWWIVASVVFPDRMLNADGDMFRHITHGSWMLEHGRLITEDPFSFSKGGAPFVAFEYGSQLLYALVFKLGGLAGVAIFAGLLIATAYALLARFLLSRGVDALLAYLTVVVAAVLGAVHWVARPHLITLLLVMVLWHFLEHRKDAVTGGSPRRLAMVFGLFVLWANMHGGFVFGLAVIGVYFAGSALEMMAHSDAERAVWRLRAMEYLLLGIVGLAGSFLTPHGWRLHQHIITTLGDSYLLNNTQEFMSPDFHEITGKLFLAVLLLVIAGFALVPRRPDFRRLLLLLALTYISLNARRNIQLFGAMVAPALALHATPWWQRLRDWRGIRAVFDRDARLSVTWPYVAAMLLLFTPLFVAGGNIGGLQVVPNSVSPVVFPAGVVERARADSLQGRLFHDFIWGGYLLHAWPEQKVFIDGGTDFYGDELMYTYINTTERGMGWRDSLARWEFDLVLVPTSSVFVQELLQDEQWKVRDCDATATLVERSGSGPTLWRDLRIAPATDSILRACGATAAP